MKIQELIYPVLENGYISFKSHEKGFRFLSPKWIALKIGVNTKDLNFNGGFEIDSDGDVILPIEITKSKASSYCKNLQGVINNALISFKAIENDSESFINCFNDLDFENYSVSA